MPEFIDRKPPCRRTLLGALPHSHSSTVPPVDGPTAGLCAAITPVNKQVLGCFSWSGHPREAAVTRDQARFGASYQSEGRASHFFQIPAVGSGEVCGGEGGIWPTWAGRHYTAIRQSPWLSPAHGQETRWLPPAQPHHHPRRVPATQRDEFRPEDIRLHNLQQGGPQEGLPPDSHAQHWQQRRAAA